MSGKTKILIVEDEKDICSFLTQLLEPEGYAVLLAANGSQALTMTASHSPELMLLDLGLPDIDGMEVLRRVREWSDLPIIVVSARQEEREKVMALDEGANDYVTKPFGNRELLARIRTALRQHARRSSPVSSTLDIGGLRIDYRRRQVFVEAQQVHLTPMEFKILSLLCRHVGEVLTHDHILREVWGPYAGDSQVLRVNMANIRRKLEPDPADPKYILTEVGVGYRLNDQF